MPRTHPLDIAHANYVITDHIDPLLTAITEAAFRQASRSSNITDEEAEDIAQTCATRIWQRLGDYTILARFSTWCYSIFANAIIDHVRARHNYEPLPVREPAPTSPAAPSAVLDTISDSDMDLVRLRYVEGYSTRDVARNMGLTESATRKRLSRLHKSLAASHNLSSSPRLISRDPNQDGESADKVSATKRRDVPQLPGTPLSLLMGPSVIEQFAQGDPSIVPIVEGWRPRARVIYTDSIPDNDIVFAG